MSTVATPRTLAHRLPVQEDAPPDRESLFREAIASRAPEHHEAFPRSTDLEARCLTAVAPILHGLKSELRGIRSAQGFRSMLAGERHLHLSDLCRMATTPGREARAATLAILTELATVIGYRLEAMPGTATDVHAALASLVRTEGEFAAEAVQDLSDGRLDADEVASLRTKLEANKKSIAAIEGALSAAGPAR